jgi:hypothetical protein
VSQTEKELAYFNTAARRVEHLPWPMACCLRQNRKILAWLNWIGDTEVVFVGRKI